MPPLETQPIFARTLRGIFAYSLLGIFSLAPLACTEHPEPKPGSNAPEPLVESIPSPVHSCAKEPRPLVTAIPVPGAPVAVTLVRAYHTCLGEYAALFRLEGIGVGGGEGARVGAGTVTQVELEKEWWSLGAPRPSRRTSEVLAWSFVKGTVRYHRVKWREGLANRGERVLRVRLAKAHLAEGAVFHAGPWPELPPPAAGDRKEGLADKLHRVGEGIQNVTRKIRAAEEKLEQHPLVRHRPAAEPPAPPR